MKTTFAKTPTDVKRFSFMSSFAGAKRVRWVERRRFDGTSFFN